MGKEKEKLVTLTLKIQPAVNERILALSSERKDDTELNKSQVARRALMIGLEMIEQNHGLLIGQKPDESKRRGRTD